MKKERDLMENPTEEMGEEFLEELIEETHEENDEKKREREEKKVDDLHEDIEKLEKKIAKKKKKLQKAGVDIGELSEEDELRLKVKKLTKAVVILVFIVVALFAGIVFYITSKF